MRKRIKDLMWGLAVIATGVGYLGENVGWWTGFKDVFAEIWWAVFIILIGLSVLVDALSLFGVIVSAVGVYLLISRFVPIASVGAVIIPVFIIAVGLSLIFGGKKRKKTVQGEFESKTVFDGKNMKFNGEIKDGTSLEAVFGGVKADFSNCTVNRNITVYAKSVFGGTEIILPDSVSVTLSGRSVFGGADSKRREVHGNVFTVHIVYECIFGGLEIK